MHTPACQWEPSVAAPTSLHTSASQDQPTSAAAASSTTHRLWQELDNPNGKMHPRAPDFNHTLATEPLLIYGCHNPSWVKDTLESMESPKNNMHGPIAPQLQEHGPWEMLSLEEALASLELMPHPPSFENLTFILHKCRKEKNAECALRLHAYLRKSGLEAHKSLGNYLVPMLVEVGSMCDAQQVFDRLVDRNEYSWTSLITGYIEYGELDHAFILYHKMQEDSVRPNGYTFVALLKACARLKDTEKGRELHAEIARKGLLECHPFIGSTLVDMYAKCGSLGKAQEVFDRLQVRDAVPWNALIAGYAEHGLGQQTLNCFQQMQLEGFCPDAITFVCSLKACGNIGAIEKGVEIHAEIVTKGLLDRNNFVGSALVDMYVKCGLLTKAQTVFDRLPVRDAVSWNALMAGYGELGLGGEVLNCLKQMQLEGISPNAVTFVCSLKACGNIRAIDKGIEIHAEIATEGILERNPFVSSTLVNMYMKCGLLAKAQEVFNKLPARHAVLWNALIAGYAEHGFGEEALDCFEQMQLEGITPGEVTFVCSLKACSSIGAVNKGRAIHAQLVKRGWLERDPFVGNALVDMYAKCGMLGKACEVFAELRVRDAVSWTALIAGYVEHGFGQEALNCFEQMQFEGISPDAVTFICSLKACGNIGAIDKGREIHAEVAIKGLLDRNSFVGSALVYMYVKCGLLAKVQQVFDKLRIRDAVLWDALITGYAECGLGQEALNCFEQMQLEGISPGAITFVYSLKACGSIGAIEKGIEIHDQIAKKGLLESDPFVGNTLVDMYSKCGLLAKAQEVFDKLPVQDAVSWTALIAGYAHLGESENVFLMLDRMRAEDVIPDGVTFLSILTVCSYAGLVEKGQTYFEAMSKDYGITPTIKHHTCMVDLLGRAGQIDKAAVIIKKMPLNPNLVLWHTVLGACWKLGNVEIGRWAFEHAVQLDEKDAAAYALMSNIYAAAHIQEDAKQVQVMQLKQQAQKKLGQAGSDVGGIVHPFLVGDRGHSQSNHKYAKLEDLSFKVREGGGSHWLPQDRSDDLKEFGLCGHCEEWAIMCSLINTPKGPPIHVSNFWVCKGCHLATGLVSKVEQQTILVRDANCFHVLKNRNCSC